MINKITLPEAAKAKLHELVMARDAALDAGRSVNTRLQALSSDADPHMRAKLAAERDKQNHRHGQLHQLTSRISQWLTELRPGVVLEAALGRSSVRYRPRVLGTAIAAARDERRRAAASFPSRRHRCRAMISRSWRSNTSSGWDKLHARPSALLATDSASAGAAISPTPRMRWRCCAIAAQPVRADALSAMRESGALRSWRRRFLSLNSPKSPFDASPR